VQDPTLHDEIQKRCGKVEGIETLGTSPHLESEDNMDIGDLDDSDIPLQDVIRDTIRSDDYTITQAGVHSQYAVESVRVNEDGVLDTTDEGEDVWAFNEAGERMSGSAE